MDSINCLVIGAGVVGLAVARELQRAGCETVVVERHPRFGMETSSRNSEVIHAGIYYAPGSLKAQLCVRGKALLYDYCRSHGVSCNRIGKLIVATTHAELALLENYRTRAQANGVDDLQLLDVDELTTMEPAIAACGGLLSPSTGIVDSHALMASLAAEFERAGGTLVYRSEVVQLQRAGDGVAATLADGYRLSTRHVVNCAGLQAPLLASWLGLDEFAPVPVPRYCKGHYYQYVGASPFNRLIYPVAVAGGLGVHVTLDLAGQVRFGPDVRWVDEPDYAFDDSQQQRFVDAIRRYYPELDEARLLPGYTGLRPKIFPEGARDEDFVLRLQRIGSGAAIHLLGIESPGLTAALAIAERVRHRLLMDFDP